MKLIKLTLHNDNKIVVNVNKLVHSMSTQDDETGNEYTRLMLDVQHDEMRQVDVTESLDEIMKLCTD